MSSPWAIPGERHWRIVDRVMLPEPVPCGGYQRLWWLPEDVAAAVEAQVVAVQGGES